VWDKRVALMAPSPWVFAVLQYHEKISTVRYTLKIGIHLRDVALLGAYNVIQNSWNLGHHLGSQPKLEII